MRRTVSLHQFMPYGAPDLIAAARRHMVGAVLSSTSLALVAFSLLCLVIPRLPHVPVTVPRIERIVDLPPPPSIAEPLPPPSAPPVAPPRTFTRGIPVPVPVPEVKWTEEDTPPSPIDPGRGTPGEAKRQGIDPLPGPLDDPLPEDPPFFADELPVPVTMPKPEYPDIAREAGIEGLVVVEAVVGKDGHVLRTVIVRSVPLLDQAALDAARRWVFKPALTNGHPVAVRVMLPFKFSLH